MKSRKSLFKGLRAHLGLAIASLIGTTRKNLPREDIGFVRMTIGENGEPIEIVKRPSNYDLTTVKTKQEDGTWKYEHYLPSGPYNPK